MAASERKMDNLLKQYLKEKAARYHFERRKDCPSEAELSDFYSGILPEGENRKIRRHLEDCFYCLEGLEQVERWIKAGGRGRDADSPSSLIQRMKELSFGEQTSNSANDRLRTSNEGDGYDNGRSLCRCKKCGVINPPESRYCRSCGLRLRIKICSKCKRVLTPDSRYCSYCGYLLMGDTKILDGKMMEGKYARMLIGIKNAGWLVGACTALLISFFWPHYFLQFLLIAVILAIKWIFDTGATRTLIMIYDTWRKRDREDEEKLSDIPKKRNRGIKHL